MIDLDCFEIKLVKPEKNLDKYDVVKLLLVKRLAEKYRNIKSLIRIYTEFDLGDNLICSVYFENMKTKEAIVYEILKNYICLDEKYKNWNEPLFNETKCISINLSDCPDKINEINKWLEKFII